MSDEDSHQDGDDEDDERFQPWVIGTEHLGDWILRIHFGGGVVRDVDLRAVLDEEDQAKLVTDSEAEVGAGSSRVGQVRTAVVWPSGVQIDRRMLELIYAGFGGRKGWPKTVPERSPDAPFPVPSLEDLGVTTYGGVDPSDRVISSSAEEWRTDRIDRVMENVQRDLNRLVLWWADAREGLGQAAEPEGRRKLLRSGLTDIAMARVPLGGLEELLRDAARGEALVGADDDVRLVVAAASRWNDAWVLKEALSSAAIFHPLENPDGFCEELRARLTNPDATMGP